MFGLDRLRRSQRGADPDDGGTRLGSRGSAGGVILVLVVLLVILIVVVYVINSVGGFFHAILP